MRVGIIQSAYLPWRGYFDFIDDVDLFLLFDDVQYVKRSWRTRNKVKARSGTQWISVPVKKMPRGTLICEMQIDNDEHWAEHHLNQIRDAYRNAPYFETYYEDLQSQLSRDWTYLSELNEGLIRWLMGHLGITTEVRSTVGLGATGRKGERLLSVLEKVGGTTYLSGPAAQSYIDEKRFDECGVNLEYKSYDYREYPQMWQGFSGDVTVLDLLFNTGPDALFYLKSATKNIVPRGLRN
ncbi:WbqC family protein [Kordiimonas sp.]|uniref:WbqC family protein n=1 Tax=Kordiimonas sp. TaxID=1970157 RepID=UPI003A8F9AB7